MKFLIKNPFSFAFERETSTLSNKDQEAMVWTKSGLSVFAGPLSWVVFTFRNDFKKNEYFLMWKLYSNFSAIK